MSKLLIISAIILSSIGTTSTQAAPTHKLWDVLLKKYVTPAGLVDYTGFKADKENLELYLRTLQSDSPKETWTKEEKMAYWINAYNAFTVKLIVDNYPVKSIKDINNGEPWKLGFIKIGSKTYTLDDIEHKILRPEFKDPRIHFAINCASISCPPLLNRAYLPGTIDKQLEQVTKSFINSDTNKITANSIAISKIFEWFKNDFIAHSGNLITFINKYSNTQIKSNAKVAYLNYNWDLNKP